MTALRAFLTLPVLAPVLTLALALAVACAVPAPGMAQEIGTSILPPVDPADLGDQTPGDQTPGDQTTGGADRQTSDPVETRTDPAQHETDYTIETQTRAERPPEAETGAAAITARRPARTTSTTGNDPLSDSLSNTLSDPLSGLRGAWRVAVETGDTELGFAAWASALLAGELAGETDGNADVPRHTPRHTLSPAPTGAEQVAHAAHVEHVAHADRTRMMSERWLARAGPVALGQAGRVVTTFGAAIPTAFCSPLMVCYIELEPGEVLTGTPSWGDTTRWQLTAKTQGLDPETIVMEIKPGEDAELTNLVIPTDRRLYTINLVNDPDIHTPILSFHYPDSAARAIADRIEAERMEADRIKAESAKEAERKAAARAAQIARTGVQTSTGAVPASELDFGFLVTGSARFKPVRVYSDGRRTFIDLHPDYRGELPTVLPGPGEDNKALNTRVSGNGTRLEADRVISDVYLQAGRHRVRIRKTGS